MPSEYFTHVSRTEHVRRSEVLALPNWSGAPRPSTLKQIIKIKPRLEDNTETLEEDEDVLCYETRVNVDIRKGKSLPSISH